MNNQFKEPSPQLIAVFNWFDTQPIRWATNREVADGVRGVAGRTVRAYTAKLAAVGVLEHREMFGGYRYRLQSVPNREAALIVQHLHEVASILAKPDVNPIRQTV